MTLYASRKTGWSATLGRCLAVTTLLLLSWPASSVLFGDEYRSQTEPDAILAETSRQAKEPVSAEIYVLPSPPDQTRAVARSNVRQRIDRFWKSRKSLVLDSGEADSGPDSLAHIVESLRRHGYGTVVGMEANLVYEAHYLMRQQHLEQARQSLDAALTLDPTYIPALSAQAEICRRRNPALVPGYLFSALTALGDSFWPSLIALTNLALVLLFTLLVLSCVLHLVLVARYQKLFRHSIQENWQERIPQPLVSVFGCFLLLLPLFLFLGPFWTFSFWTSLLWRFARRVERLLAVLSLVFLAFLTPATDTVVDTFHDLNIGDLHLFSDALTHQLLSPRGEMLIREEEGATGSSEPLNYARERQFVVASIEQKMGRDDDAFERYATIPVFHYLYPMAQNNIGNIYFSINQFDLAIQHYRKALDVRPDYADCYFNLSNAQFQVYDFDHSDQSLSRAQRLDPLTIGKLINKDSRGLKTLEHQLPESFLWDLAWSVLRHNADRHFSGLGLEASGRGRSGRDHTTLLLLASALAAALVGFLLGWIHRHEEICRCRSCGRSYCRLCGPDPLKHEFCQQCIHLHSRMSGVSPEIRKRKLRQIRRHQLWEQVREGLLTVTMPGVEGLRCGRTFSGATIAATWFFLVTILTALPRLLPQIGLRAAPWSLNPLLLVAGALATVLWTVSLMAWLVRRFRQGWWGSLGTVRSGGERN